MRIVVNHLTRMQRGFICVAGIELQTGDHIRPVIPGARLTTGLLARYGGPFDIAVEVDIGTATPSPQIPEVEDHIFEVSAARAIETLDPERFWKLLVDVAKHRLVEIFGENLTRTGNTYTVEPGKGQASLGCLTPSPRPTLFLRPRQGKPDEIRISFGDDGSYINLPVTDIRLYGDDHITPAAPVVEELACRLANADDHILSVGLTRPFASSPNFAPVHWLQVNNIHLANKPIWQLK